LDVDESLYEAIRPAPAGFSSRISWRLQVPSRMSPQYRSERHELSKIVNTDRRERIRLKPTE
jgi:hypothetical protein